MEVGRAICPVCKKSFDSTRMLAGHRAGKHRTHVGVKASVIEAGHLSDSQKGYVAAFLDGEGGLQITRSARIDREYTTALHPDVYFTNTNQEAIQSIKKWLGGGSITKRKGRANHKASFILTISGVRSILELLTTIRPLLIIKAERADLMMEYCRSRISHYRGKGRQFTPNELRLYTAIKRLNLKGGGATNANTR